MSECKFYDDDSHDEHKKKLFINQEFRINTAYRRRCCCVYEYARA